MQFIAAVLQLPWLALLSQRVQCCVDSAAEQRQLLYQLCLLGREVHSQAHSLPLELKVQNSRGRENSFMLLGQFGENCKMGQGVWCGLYQISL